MGGVDGSWQQQMDYNERLTGTPPTTPSPLTAALHHCTATPHCTTALPPLTAPHCTTTPLTAPHCTTSTPHCTTAPLHHCTTAPDRHPSLYHCISTSHCLTAPPPLIAPLHHHHPSLPHHHPSPHHGCVQVLMCVWCSRRHRMAGVACNVMLLMYELLFDVCNAVLMFVSGAGCSRARRGAGRVQAQVVPDCRRLADVATQHRGQP